jgi:hypothetical protein
MSHIHEQLSVAGKKVFEQGESITHPLDITDVSFSKQAQMTLREAVSKIAEYCQVDPGLLSEKLDQKVYWLEPSCILMITIDVPEIDADMFIEIPPGHWWINETIRSV